MCTRQENVMHSMVHKLRDDYGENSVNAKLTNEQADHIRRLHRSGVMQNELAEQSRFANRRYAISSTIKSIKNESDKRNN